MRRLVRALGSRLAVRVAAWLLVVTGLGVAVMAAYVTWALERHSVDALRAGLVTQARLLHDLVAPTLRPGPEVQALAHRHAARIGARVTVIAPDGTVLADSERDPQGVREMENHASRPEVRAALAGGVGSNVRRSDTLHVDMLYVAIPIEDRAGVLRLALPMPEVARALTWVRRTVMAGALLALGLAIAAGVFVSRRVTRPVAGMRAVAHRMTEGQFDQAVPVRGTDEIAELGQALNRLAVALREKIQHLETERTKVATILDSMVEGVVALDGGGRFLLTNPAARALFRRGDEAIVGRPLVEVIRHKELVDLVETMRRDPAATPARREIELGPPLNRVLAVRGAPTALLPGESAILLVFHDVTDLRRLERVRTEFVASVSHELRTPLTCIRGYLETLLDGGLEDPTQAVRFLEVANTHAERLSRLVDDLLDLSNIETGTVTLAPAALEVAEVTRGVVAIFEPKAAQRGVTLGNMVTPGLTARADRDRLAQILLNLVDNAVKFTPAGGRVTVAARTASGLVEVRVADTGIGIPSSDLPRLTERFYRVDKARSRDLGGTGLGLAIVKHLVQAQGGELRIESELGRGTTVSFTLPAA